MKLYWRYKKDGKWTWKRYDPDDPWSRAAYLMSGKPPLMEEE